jgi:predicted lipoprotein with Yx(FWY)xxD motif
MRSTNMKIATAAVLAAIALAACSSSSKSGSSTTSPPTQAPTTAAPATSGSTGTFTVATATKSVKGSQQKILVDSNGMTLYVNEKDGVAAAQGDRHHHRRPRPDPVEVHDGHRVRRHEAGRGQRQPAVPLDE